MLKMPMEIHLYPAQPADAAAVVALIRLLAQENGEASPLDETAVLAYLAQPDNAILLAVGAGQVVGLISYHLHPNLYHAAPVCLIEELVIVAAARRQGVGGRLVRAVIEIARARGCAEVSVSTLAENQAALAFYRRHGLVDEAVLLERHFG